MTKRYLDPYERSNEPGTETNDDENQPEIAREFVKARLHSRAIVITLPHEVRQPVGVVAGSKLLLTSVDAEEAQKILREGKKGILITKE